MFHVSKLYTKLNFYFLPKTDLPLKFLLLVNSIAILPGTQAKTLEVILDTSLSLIQIIHSIKNNQTKKPGHQLCSHNRSRIQYFLKSSTTPLFFTWIIAIVSLLSFCFYLLFCGLMSTMLSGFVFNRLHFLRLLYFHNKTHGKHKGFLYTLCLPHT